MKIFVITVYLMATQALCAASSSLYSIECASTDAATLTVNKDGYTLSSSVQKCTPNTNVQNTYNLDSNCLLGATITLTKKTQIGEYVKGEDIHTFTLECIPDDGVYTASVKAIFADPNHSAQRETVKFQPTDRVKLYILDTEPPGGIDTASLSTTTSATIGNTIYLTIIDSYKTDKLIIPRKCTVQAGTSGAPNILWNLDSANGQNACFKETAVVEKLFISGLTKQSEQFSYMEITAFKLTTDENAELTFTCEVRVCTAATKSQGSCTADKDALDICIPPPITNPVGKRRRREAGDAATPHGRIHHVTATLRVVDDVMAHGTDGSSTITYTLPCLLMSLLAKVIL